MAVRLIGLPRLVARRAVRAVSKSPVGAAVLRAHESGLVREENRHREAANQAWFAGARRDSMTSMRKALTVRGGTAHLWRTHAMRLVETGESGAASEAVRVALVLDPTDADAIELFVELVRKRTGSYRGVRRVVVALGEQMETRPERHRDALDFLLPFGIAEGRDAILRGPDRVAAAIVRLDRGDAADEALSGLSPEQATEARARFALARGRVSPAVAVLGTMPAADLPIAALRRAVRRGMTKSDPSGMRHLLRQYRRRYPDDGWARARLAEVERYVAGTVRARETVRLADEGFPLREAVPARPAATRGALYLLHNSLPYASAGYATRTHGLLRSLSDRGWDMWGVTRPGFPFDLSNSTVKGPVPGQDLVDGVPYLRLSTDVEKPSKNPLAPYVADYVERIRVVAERVQPFVIHAASNHWNGLAAVEAGRALGVPSIYEVRGLWEVTRASRDPEWAAGQEFRYMARMEADAARAATHVFAITRALMDELIDRGVPADKITLLPNGVDSTRFVPRERDEALAAELGVAGKTVIGYIGSILDYEGLDQLVEATARLAARRDDFHVLVVGDGAAMLEVRRRADALGLDRVLTFTGRVPHEDVERYYSLVDIAPLPRLPLPVCEMVSPLKPFEAMAMGKVVVASDVAALAEIVDDGRTGLLHKKGDVESLAAALERLLDEPAMLTRLGEQAREWVVRERDWSQIGGRISDVYDMLRGRASV